MAAEPLSDGERAVVASAEAEARKLHHDRLGTEHLLLGVLSHPGEPGARALAKLGVTLGPTRAQVMRIVGLPETPSPPALTQTPMARSALGGALREAIEAGHTTVASEHVLLAMLREREVVRLRFEEDLTQAEIGERIGVSQMQVSRVLRQAIARLRTLARVDNGAGVTVSITGDAD